MCPEAESDADLIARRAELQKERDELAAGLAEIDTAIAALDAYLLPERISEGAVRFMGRVLRVVPP